MRWHYENIPYDSIVSERIEKNDFLFLLVTTASFIEITSDVYEKNLVEFYKEDEDVVEWLRTTWEPEEIQHGKALRRYIETVWKDFDWQKGYDRFRELYLPLCTLEEFQPSPAKEMLARMVVETGTSTFYRALERYAKDLEEPVLAQIAHNISKDEVYHYDHFFEAFKKYNRVEKLGKKEIVQVIYARLKMAESEDTKLAFQAIAEAKGERFEERAFESYKKEISRMAKRYYPYNMAIKMLLQPLQMGSVLEKASVPIVRGALRIVGV